MSGAAAPAGDPWSWLLGRTATGGWRHAPFKALDPGQGQDPSLEPRVEVIRRLIAYPPRAFAALVNAVRAADTDPRRPIQWCCHRSSGEAPARPYWLSFMRPKDPKGRRFYIAIELFDREACGLWFLSGFQDSGVPREARAPFPEQPRIALPRFDVRDASIEKGTHDIWIRLAFMDALRTFDAGRIEAETIPPSSIEFVDQSQVIDAIPSVAKSSSGHSAGSSPTRDPAFIDTADEEPPSVRSARARLVVCPAGKTPIFVPLARLVTVIGRDPRCDLVLDDRSISGEHARIVYREGVPTIEDLGSKNGTRVGTEALKKNAAPFALGAEAYIGLGNVGAYFVRDADETQPPGQPAPVRHKARMDELVAHGALTRDAADRAAGEARTRGVTPAEALLTGQAVTPEVWAGVPKLSAKGGGGCVVFFALILTLLLALSGCQSMAIPPFYEQSIDENVPMREGEREITWEEDIGLHPLLQVRDSEKEDRVEVEWLFPMGHYERKGEDKRIRFYPFYLREVRVDPDGFKHDTTVCFPPGLFAGSHPVRGDFVYLFPFGGKMHGLFGKDEIVGVFFPLYGWTRDRGVETHHFLFPLIAWWSGGDEKATQEGFRILPFYGHQKKVTAEGVTVFERNTILWPFISWVHSGKNSRNPFDSIFIFPFWGKTRSDWRDEDTVLWPFFRYTHDKQKNYVEWRLPFPFFYYGHEDETPGAVAQSRFDIWPFFGVRTRGETFYRQFALWPIQRYERQETDDYVDTRFWIVPFVYTMSRVSKKNPNAPNEPEWSARKTRVWPFVRYKRTKEGDVECHALCPLWFDDVSLNFDTILDPLYRIFRYVDRKDGTNEVDVLLGLYASRRKPDGSSSWNVLGGLFGHKTSAAGEGSVRLFWFLNI